MNSEEDKTVECPYCGKEFTEENSEYDPETQKGVHISKEHVNDGEVSQGPKKGDSIVDEWKKSASAEGGRA